MDNLTKKFYKISEVADILNIPASTLRFWESKFTVINPRRNNGGTRFYTPEDIEKIKMIHYLVKVKGLKIEAAQDQIRNNISGVSRHALAVQRLQNVREKLNELLITLNKMR
ncbi:MAG: MerR family transcriptional regulator [Muribaculaceae bacterium]